jgi:hypothetical protein
LAPGAWTACARALTGEGVAPIAVLGGQSRLTDIAVPAGKRIGAALANARSTTVAWHGVLASLSDARGRW